MANGDRRRTAVRDYYDANTWKFLLTGNERAIHRELWGPGVTSRAEALHHAHAVVLDQLGPGDRRVLDLGCGVGTAALYLARRRPVEVVGVSVSPAQVRLADRFAARGGPLQGRVRFAVADFTALPSELAGFDLAFAIESFVHADPAAAFFDQAALDDVRAGWHAPSLLSVAEAEALAADAGLALVASHDLSSLQRLGRPRDRFIHAILPLLRRARTRSMWAQSLVGGDALQHCHRARLLEYRMLRFERRTT
jgi:SAM-dependent methyltransferase